MTTTPELEVHQEAPATPSVVRRVPVWAWLVIGMVLMSLARIITGAEELNSSGTLREAVMAAIPIALAALAGLWSERAGVVNIGLEGMMILGTLGAGYFGFWYGPWAGVFGAILFGALGGALHALAAVVFDVDHIVSGVAINIIAAGAASFLARIWFTNLPGGGQNQSPPLKNLPSLTIGPVADAARSVENKHWFFVSDIASVLGAVTRGLSVLTIIAVLLIAGTGWLLWRTSFGLRLRSCGESPVAAESLGVNVYRYKFLAVVVSGGLAGLGGCFIAMVQSSGFQDGQTGGRGYIGLAAMIFGNWRPGGLILGSSLFGFTDALQLRAGGEAVRALLLILAVILLGVTLLQLRRGNRKTAVVSAVVAIGFLVWFLQSDAVPAAFTTMTPYVATLLVLALASQRLRMPAADGQGYRRGKAG